MENPTRPAAAFLEFLDKFPPVEPPVMLGEDTHHAFSTENEPLTETLIFDFINQEGDDEFTEYVPCFSLETDGDFHAVVWWKAGLLVYEYVLATFTQKGQPIARQVIAITRVEGEIITRSVANISEDLLILVAVGMAKGEHFDPTTSKSFHVEMLASGDIIRHNAAFN